MKKIKINIETISSMAMLTETEMDAIVGGYDTETNNHCLFNCMEYISKNVYHNYDYDYMYFGYFYVEGIGNYSGSSNYNDFHKGPELTNDDGSFNQNITDCISACFGTMTSGFLNSDDALNLFANGSNSGVIGFYQTAEYTAHCVIITGYDSNTECYTYIDPSKSVQDLEHQRIPKNDLIGAIDCMTK